MAAGTVVAAEDVLRLSVNDGRLVKVLAGYDLPSRPMHVVYAADRRQTSKLRTFIDAAVTTLG